MTPHIEKLFRPQFATQDADIYAVLLKTWQDFAESLIRWPNAPTQPADMVTAVGILEQRGRITRWIPRLAVANDKAQTNRDRRISIPRQVS